jgi:hypothetical protein
MPISVVCGSCQAKLNAPDAAAGKSVKCPKCKAAITVPEPAASQFEVVDEEPAPAPAAKKKAIVPDEDEKPRKKRPVVDEDDEEDDKPKKKKRAAVEDDDEEDDDRPKKKKKKKAVAAVDSGNMARTIIGAVVLLIALGIAAYVWWDRNRKMEQNEKSENNPPSQTQTPTPPQPGPTPPGPSVSTAGWKQFDFPQAKIRLHWSAQPTADKQTPNGSARIKHEGGELNLNILIVAPQDSKQAFEALEQDFVAKAKMSNPKDSTLSGRPAREYESQDNVARVAVIGGRFHLVAIGSTKGRASKDVEKFFFDKFEVSEPTAIKLTVKELLAERDAAKGDTSGLLQKYGGRLVELEGEIKDVSLHDGKLSVRMMPTGLDLREKRDFPPIWHASLPDAKDLLKLRMGRVIRIRGTFGNPVAGTAVEWGEDHAIRVSAEEFLKEAANDPKSAHDKYWLRPVILTGEIKGRSQQEGGPLCIELAGGDEKAGVLVALPSTSISSNDDPKSPQVGKKVMWTGEMHSSGDLKRWTLWQCWPVSDDN